MPDTSGADEDDLNAAAVGDAQLPSYQTIATTASAASPWSDRTDSHVVGDDDGDANEKVRVGDVGVIHRSCHNDRIPPPSTP